MIVNTESKFHVISRIHILIVFIVYLNKKIIHLKLQYNIILLKQITYWFFIHHP